MMTGLDCPSIHHSQEVPKLQNIMLLQHQRPRGGGTMVGVVVSLVQVVFIPNIAILVGDLVCCSR